MTYDEFKAEYLAVIEQRKEEFTVACDEGCEEAIIHALITPLVPKEELEGRLNDLMPNDIMIGYNSVHNAWLFIHRNYECRIYAIGNTRRNASYIVAVIEPSGVFHICPDVIIEELPAFNSKIPDSIIHMVDGILDNVLHVAESEEECYDNGRC